MLGEEILKGMAVTAKNFLGSYVSKERLTTVQYPEGMPAQVYLHRQEQGQAGGLQGPDAGLSGGVRH
jgi:hypothetical protein